MTNDIIRRLREAIAAGPTPGYWDADFASAMRNGSPAVVEYFVRRDGDDISIAADIVDPSSGLPSAVNANYIAAASPDNIAALLGRLDKAERERDALSAKAANARQLATAVCNALGVAIMHDAPNAIDLLREDAERYRLIRRGQHWSVIDGIGDSLRAEQLDAAIDAVRAAEQAHGIRSEE